MPQTPEREPGGPADPTASGGSDGSSRFLLAWDLLFVVLVTVGTTRAFTLDGPVAHPGIITTLAAATTAWYMHPLFLGWSSDGGDRSPAWLGGVVAGSVTLSVLAPDFAWLAFPIAFQLGYRLRAGVAAGAGVALAATAIVGLASEGDRLQLAEVIGPSLGVTMAIIVAIGYRTVLDQRDRNRHLLEQLTATQQRLGEAERERGIAEERARLSREIHDTLAQGLASSVLHVQAIARDLVSDPGARDRLDDVEQQLRDGLEEARRFVRDLAPADLDDTPLTDGLRRLCHHDGRGHGPTVTFEVSGQPHPLPTDHEVTLYRSAQEAISNTRKHAAADHLRVTLTYLDNATVLDVVDDGTGFDPHATTTGHGLRGMRARLHRIGGHLDLEAAQGRGTALAATVPLPETDDAHER